jgi:hypothetical protein
MRSSWDTYIAAAVEKIVEHLLDRIDPDERQYPDHASLSDLEADLEEVLDGRIGDWEIEQREKHGK